MINIDDIRVGALIIKLQFIVGWPELSNLDRELLLNHAAKLIDDPQAYQQLLKIWKPNEKSKCNQA